MRKLHHELVVKLSKFNFDRSGFEAQEGESDEDELVRQIVVGSIAADDQAAVTSRILLLIRS